MSSRVSFAMFRRTPLVAATSAALLLAACESVEDKVTRHLDLGLELVEAGELGKAMLEFRSALQLDENLAPAYFEIAKIQEERGNARSAPAGEWGSPTVPANRPDS